MPDRDPEAEVVVLTGDADEAGLAGTAAPTLPEDELLAAVAGAVLAVPGVLRLEPTLSTAGPGVLVRSSPADGVRLVVRSGVVAVDVSIAVGVGSPARTVAHDVQASVARQLDGLGRPDSSVTVSVLEIDPTNA